MCEGAQSHAPWSVKYLPYLVMPFPKRATVFAPWTAAKVAVDLAHASSFLFYQSIGDLDERTLPTVLKKTNKQANRRRVAL